MPHTDQHQYMTMSERSSIIAPREPEIPEYRATVPSRVPHTFGQVPYQMQSDSSKMTSPNKAELLYQEAYSMSGSNKKFLGSSYNNP